MKIIDNIAYIGEIGKNHYYYEYDDTVITDAFDVVSFLSKHDKPKFIVNSIGGDVAEAVQIYNELKKHGNATIEVSGVAYSAASFFIFGAKKLSTPKNSLFMVHKPSSFVWGDADEMRKSADILDKYQEAIETIYNAHKKADVTEKQITNFLNKETFFTGEEFANFFNIELVDVADFSENKIYNKLYNKVLNLENSDKINKKYFKNFEPTKNKKRGFEIFNTNNQIIKL